jgi:hypothetical protein
MRRLEDWDADVRFATGGELPSNSRRSLKVRSWLSGTGWVPHAPEGRLTPQPVRLGARAVGWLESEVDAWIRQKIEGTRSGL